MTPAELLVDGFTRIQEGVHAAVDGLTADQLAHQPAERANSVGWLIWHLTRVQDDHVADAAGFDQVWTSGGFEQDFGLPFEASETGYGATPQEVAQVRGLSAEQLTGYLDAVHAQTVRWVKGLAPEDLDRVVDERWDPPVTLGVRLVSVVNDDQQHVGQAAYVRGLLL
ncbi:DinB family protein [Pedococcus sp. KACC 23699]|uniref:DinB family protein n=1 Tax=Pedococcus sp. KACC 23699 TaxID=3149228 RepID=A0AAU7JY49_9MICO